jgi:hypothetical protein
VSHNHAAPLEPARYDGRALGNLTGIGAALGVVGLGAALALAGGTKQFYFSWLVAYLYFLSIALGALFFVLVLAVTRAAWGVVIRRLLENTMATLPVFALLFVPIWLGRHELYEWTHADVVTGNPLLKGKSPFLNEGFSFVRALYYFTVWSALAVYFSSQTQRQDQTGDEGVSTRLRGLAPVGILVFSLTSTFAAVDWMMSLQPEWYSTMIGVYYFAGAVIGILSFTVLLIHFAYARGVLQGIVTVEHQQDIGKLLFGFTIFWAYIGFSQYFLIWYANIPEETLYYIERGQGSWQTLGMVLAVGHFAFPFFFLMPRAVKRNSSLMIFIAVWQLAMHFLDLHWCVMPVLHHEGMRFGMTDIAAFAAVGGIFLAALGWVSSRRALVPLKDPRLPESLSFENV